jgi:ureidoacrylate peracid hydrolase
MQNYVVPASMKDRVVSRMRKLLVHDTIEAGRTALLVVNMRNYFCAPGFPLEMPVAREIAPNINRIARVVRAAGGAVVWIQMTAVGALEHWANFQTRMLTPDRQKQRLAGLDEASEGFRLFPQLEVPEGDLRVKKIKYSAFTPGSSDIDARLKGPLHRHALDRRRGDERVLRVNCARRDDARLQGHHVVGRHRDMERRGTRGALNTFMMFFGDVMSIDEAIAWLTPVAGRKTA